MNERELERVLSLLRRALKQMIKWNEWYGEADRRFGLELPLPPAGDVELAEDIGEELAR